VSESRTVLPAPKLLNLIGIRATENAITLVAKTSSCVARCPVCRKHSARIHSRYARTLTDLPWQGVPVTVRLRVRRFFCDERSCARAIFAERLPGLAAHYGRRTERAKASGIAEMNAFAVKLLQDSEAVIAAMTLPYSQGQTEGRVNKLKLVKRSMYGRGKFDLLRQRVLYEAS
jgi:transposase